MIEYGKARPQPAADAQEAREAVRRLEAENAWLRAALECAREDGRLGREALRSGHRPC